MLYSGLKQAMEKEKIMHYAFTSIIKSERNYVKYILYLYSLRSKSVLSGSTDKGVSAGNASDFYS